MIRARLLAGGALMVCARIAWADPLPESRFGLPRDVSLDGHYIDSLIHFTIIATGIIFVVVFAAMLYAAFRHNASHEAHYDHGDRRRSAALVLGLVGVIVLVVDGNLFGETLHDLHAHFWNYGPAESNPATVRIEVMAHQWAWLARYAGADGKFNTPDDVVTLDDIRIPVGVPVLLQIGANDVIHSFFLPNFRVKQDAVPGMVTRLLFQAQKTGEYEIACAQHCGPNHYKMRGVLTVLEPTAYQQWLSAVQADARRGYDPDDKEAHWGWEWRK